MSVIGVTGTDGKTTTAMLIHDMLQAAGYKVAILTTVSAQIAGKSYDTGFHVTTPSSFMLQKYFLMAKKAGVEYFILETTSHGLDQNRVFGIHYIVSAITNISSEHLDYHKTYEKYVEAKTKIIAMSDTVVLNNDDTSYKYILELKEKNTALHNKKYVTYGLGNNSEVNPEKYPLNPSMSGEFNLYNSLAALGVCLQLGIEYDVVKDVVEEYKTPKGRQDIIIDSPFTVMVDFAHTPNSFQAILSSLRQNYSGSIIHVFGSAGERDYKKRPEMGKISSQFADRIILTAEDPRSEKVGDINDDIKKGISHSQFVTFNEKESQNKVQIEKNKKYVFEISDRKKAIEFALSIADKGDIVVITGKGHEQSMNLGNGEISWSDHDVVQKAVEKYEKK